MSSKPSLDMTKEELAQHIYNAENYKRDKVSANSNTYLAADLERSSYSQRQSFIMTLVAVIRDAKKISREQWQAISDLVVAGAISEPELQSSIVAKLESHPSTGIPEILKCLQAIHAVIPNEVYLSLRAENGPEEAIDLATLALQDRSEEWHVFFAELVQGVFGDFTTNVMKSRYSVLVRQMSPLFLMRYLKKASESEGNEVDITEISEYVARRAGISSDTMRSHTTGVTENPIISSNRLNQIASRTRKIGNAIPAYT